MRVRLERYEMREPVDADPEPARVHVRRDRRSCFFGFLTFLGIPDDPHAGRAKADGLWAAAGRHLLGFFLGVVPCGISTLVIAWGVRQRGRFRRFGELAAIARQTAMLSTPQVAHALRLSTGRGRPTPHRCQRARPHRARDRRRRAAATPSRRQHPPRPERAPATPDRASAERAPASAPPISSGTVLGDAYRIEEPLGRGGMGAVYAARHLRTGRRYAVKTILAGANASEDAIRRFEREATAASALGHPGIVQVHDFNVAPGGLFYLVMDLLEGETLDDRLDARSRSRGRTPSASPSSCCAALGAAHEHGLLHRDIKPSNIFLVKRARKRRRRSACVLVDFGLVKSIAETGSHLTSTGAVVGTPMYMSPEQARGEALDVRSDLYSLAAVDLRGRHRRAAVPRSHDGLGLCAPPQRSAAARLAGRSQCRDAPCRAPPTTSSFARSRRIARRVSRPRGRWRGARGDPRARAQAAPPTSPTTERMTS